jgi:hypothetical protein
VGGSENAEEGQDPNLEATSGEDREVKVILYFRKQGQRSGQENQSKLCSPPNLPQVPVLQRTGEVPV